MRIDVAIIGGGIVGCASAFYLSRLGAKVVLLEQGQLNRGASGRNAGSLHFQLEHRLIQHRRHLGPVLECLLGLHSISRDLWKGIEADLESDVGVAMHGGLMIAETYAEAKILEEKAALECGHGISSELITGGEARVRCPALATGVQAASFCGDEGRCNPRLITLALAQRATELGATIMTETRVERTVRSGSSWRLKCSEWGGAEVIVKADFVLNAANATASEVGRLANLHVPVFPVALTMSITERMSPFLQYLIQHVGKRLSLKQLDSGNLVIGGGCPARLLGGVSDRVDDSSISSSTVIENLRTAVGVIPALRSTQLLRCWSGTTGLTTDQLPLLGPMTTIPGYFVAVGGNATTYGLAYGKLSSELIAGNHTSIPIDSFLPSRFGHINMFMGAIA